MTRPLWTREELTAALGLLQPADLDANGVSIDSRTLEDGDLFIALSGGPDVRYRGAAGSGRDGHDFIPDAERRGAAGAVVCKPTQTTLPLLTVPDTFTALWDLAAAARERFQHPVFAITGSSGKTTAKGMLAAALPAAHASEGSFNNHIGVPLSLARLPQTAEAGIFEIGMNSPGEIAPLTELVKPDVALVLNVLGVHLEGLGSLAAIRREKLSIAKGLGPNGILVVPDDLHLTEQEYAGRHMTFGRSETADLRLLESEQGAAVILPDGSRHAMQLTVDGPHRRLTATAVLACLYAAGLDVQSAMPRLEALEPPKGRGGSLKANGICIIDDSYNANPDSVKLALEGLKERPAGRRWALLGDMLELGAEEMTLHASLAASCTGLDGVFCVGQRMAALRDALPEELMAGWWPDCDVMDIDIIAHHLHPGDCILVKASNRLFWKADTVARLVSALKQRGGAVAS